MSWIDSLSTPDLSRFRAFLDDLSPTTALIALVVAALLAGWLVRKVLVRVVCKVAAASPMHWDDAVVRSKALHRAAHIVPALVLSAGMPAIDGLPPLAYVVVHNASLAWIALMSALVVGNLLDAFDAVYREHSRHARDRPIKGYLQLLKILVWVVAAILVVSAILDRSPAGLLTGLGAMTAVVLLVFRDTILSLVANLQLSTNDMLRVGDWIEMPDRGVDGDVIDISLHTVKVQNWDKTISTLPTHLLISESYRNWRGMTEAGGRRIKRALYIDQASVRFLDQAERTRLRRIALIDDYLDRQREELEQHNAELEAAGKDPVNNRRATNLGTFRAYATAYLRSHPGVHQDLTLMVRQLDPTPAGLPLQVYCFAKDTDWVAYEGLAGDLFDHLLAMVPEFGLRLYQQPGGGDVADAVQALGRGHNRAGDDSRGHDDGEAVA